MTADGPREYDHEFEMVLSHKARRRTWVTFGDEWVEIVQQAKGLLRHTYNGVVRKG